jgi:hypothetical protein
MFQILYPLGLLAAAGIAIPIIIHLWNIKSGKTLKIGSVFLLGKPSNQRSRSLKVQDWPLLLIRSLLILLIGLLLTNPVLYKKISTKGQPGWILLEKEYFSKMWSLQHKSLDSLVKAGYEIHDFAPNFSKIDLKDTSTVFSIPPTAKLPYYSLIRELDVQLPAGTSAYIFANRQQHNFEGEKPTTSLNLHWNYLPVDTAKMQWTAAAYQLQKGGSRKLEAQLTEKGIYYKASNDKAYNDVSLLDTATIRIQIYEGKNKSDAAYVQAGIQSIADFTQRKIVVEHVGNINGIKQNTDLLFWLSDNPLRNLEIKKLPEGIRLFSYAGNKAAKFRSEIVDLQGTAMQNVILYQKAIQADAYDKPIWQDGSGTPILSLTDTLGLQHYKFYSRFNPEWSNMVWSDQMVFFLMPLVLPESTAAEGFRDAAKLPISADELNVDETVSTRSATEQKLVEQDLMPYVWACLLIVFFVERWITYNKRNIAL